MFVKELLKKYNGKTVVDGVSFELPKGKVISLIGPNGAGKSTVMGMISRLIAQDDGSVDFEGKDMSKWKSRDLARRLAILTQSNHVQMKLTVRELVAFGRFPYSGNRITAEDEEIIEKAIAYMELEEFEDRFIDELSGGQRQRVLIAMALTRDPKLIIADEPTTALDVTVQKQVIDLLNKLQKELGFAMVFVSHDLALVAEVANSITVMYAGQVVEQGPVSDILCHPVHEYTRGLLGSVLSIEAGGTRLHQVPGSVPSPKDFPEGDRFTPRSSHPDKVSQLRPVLKRVSDSDHYYAELPDSELKRLGIKPYVPGGAII